MTSALHDVVAERLGDTDQRYTTARRALIDVLQQADGPLSIPEVIAANPAAPQSSVYRNLTVLENAGVLRRVAGSDEYGRFELSEELTEHHHHLVCRSCGRVEDHGMDAGVEEALEAVAKKIKRSTGFAVDTHQLDLVGLCQRCR